MGRGKDVFFLARRKILSVAEETGKIQVISRESPLWWGSNEPLPAKEVGAPLPGISELHPKRVGLDSLVACLTKGSSATLSTPEALWLSGISEGEERDKLGKEREKGDNRVFVYAVP